MTILRAYSVRDVVSNTYGRPFFSQNDATAVRSLAMEVNNSSFESVLHTNPDDFELYLIGEFDDELCTFDSLSAIQLLCRCSSLVKAPGAVNEVNRTGTPQEV